MKKTSLLLMAPLLLFAACRHQGRPSDVMDDSSMVAFLSDAYLLEGFYAVETEYRYDALTPEVVSAYDSILALHSLTREDVERSFDYFAAHPDEYAPIQDRVLAILDSLSGSDGQAIPMDTAAISTHIIP